MNFFPNLDPGRQTALVILSENITQKLPPVYNVPEGPGSMTMLYEI